MSISTRIFVVSFRVGKIYLLLVIMTFFHIMDVKNVGLGRKQNKSVLWDVLVVI